MADLLWQKPGVAVDAQIQTFLAGDDVILDREFFLHDIAASAAHAQGLQHIGILSADELAGLLRELDVLAQDFREGRFVLDTQYEGVGSRASDRGWSVGLLRPRCVEAPTDRVAYKQERCSFSSVTLPFQSPGVDLR